MAGGLLDATFGFLAAATIQLRLGTGCTIDLAERRPHRRLDAFSGRDDNGERQRCPEAAVPPFGFAGREFGRLE